MRAVAIREKILGRVHPEVAASLSNLATALRELGRYEDSPALFERAVKVFEETTGSRCSRIGLDPDQHGAARYQAG